MWLQVFPKGTSGASRISQCLREATEMKMTREVMPQRQDFEEITQHWEQGGVYWQV